MKKKIMHILNTNDYSGAENVAITIIRAMQNEMEGVYVSLSGPIKEYLDEYGITYYPVRKLSIMSVRKAIRDIDPDIIHAHDFTAGIECALTGTHIPIVNHIHNNSPWLRRYNLKSFVYAISCHKYRKVLTVSDSVMDEYVFGNRFKNKTEVIGNPIDTDKIRNLAGHPDIIYDVAFLGRFSIPKNPHMFLDIIKELKENKSDIKAVMIGDGDLRTEIEQRIRENGLTDNITLTGFQKNPYIYLNQAKLLCMPSIWEGYGLAAVEALALGKPVVCSKAGGLPTIVDDSCGKLCEKKEEYLDYILKMIGGQNDLLCASRAAIEKADRIDNLESYTRKLLHTYLMLRLSLIHI